MKRRMGLSILAGWLIFTAAILATTFLAGARAFVSVGQLLASGQRLVRTSATATDKLKETPAPRDAGGCSAGRNRTWVQTRCVAHDFLFRGVMVCSAALYFNVGVVVYIAVGKSRAQQTIMYFVRSLTPPKDFAVKKQCTEVNDAPAFTGVFSCDCTLLCFLYGTALCIIQHVSAVVHGCCNIGPVYSMSLCCRYLVLVMMAVT